MINNVLAGKSEYEMLSYEVKSASLLCLTCRSGVDLNILLITQ